MSVLPRNSRIVIAPSFAIGANVRRTDASSAKEFEKANRDECTRPSKLTPTAPREAQSNAPIARRDDRSLSLSGRSPGSRAHPMMRANRLPTPVERRSGSSIRRCSFTVAGAVPGLVRLRLNTHRLSVSLAVAPGRSGKTAKHLTTSPRMLTAVRKIGKLQTHPARWRV